MAKQSRADYYREYRATKAEMKENKNAELQKEGVRRCVEYLRTHVANQAITGYKAAMMIERALFEIELPEATARKEFIEQLRAGQT